VTFNSTSRRPAEEGVLPGILSTVSEPADRASTRERSGERGLTLPEVLVGLLLFTIVAMTVAGMLTQGMKLNATGKDYATLTNVAKDKLEELMARPFIDPVNAANTAWPLAPGVHTEERSDLGLELTWRVTEHQLSAGNTDPATAFGDDPVSTSTVALNTGNIKVVTLTVASSRQAALGQRNVTVQGIKILG
jgi:prepilin-type N-terminal cleavage/methylation domain-containing protein